MAHLTKPKKYDIKDSNIELLGSDLEKNVRQHAGDTEPAWDQAGAQPGLQIWRIEQFKVVLWDRGGEFYDGDSYIVLHTYKSSPDSDTLSYDLHFWLGENTTQDEAGTAAYKTVELDDHLNGIPIQYREVQSYESDRFLSYFPKFTTLSGGVATGFHHVTSPPPLDIHKLYRITLLPGGSGRLVIREVPCQGSSLIRGDVYVLDKGTKVLQLNTNESVGREKFKAAEFSRELVDARKDCELVVYDESSSPTLFLLEFGPETKLLPPPLPSPSSKSKPKLFHLSDAAGSLTFNPIPPPISRQSLSSQDVFILDDPRHRIVWVWVGSQASHQERRMGVVYAQKYMYIRGQEILSRSGDDGEEGEVVAECIVKMNEGKENEVFLKALEVDS